MRKRIKARVKERSICTDRRAEEVFKYGRDVVFCCVMEEGTRTIHNIGNIIYKGDTYFVVLIRVGEEWQVKHCSKLP